MSVTGAWLIYSAVISVLVGLAALVAERSMREVGRPARWIWLGAMLLSVAVPVAAYFDAPVANGAGMVPGVVPLTLLPLVVVAEQGGGWWSVDRMLMVLWVVCSVSLAGYLMVVYRRLRVAQTGWRRTEVGGVPVWLTADLGPAVFGVGTSMILLPAWAFAMEKRLQHLLLLHEREHVRAGDPRLVLAGIVLVVLVPWHLALWWMLRRMRLAIEVDCDARVLRQDPDARAYGSLLLEVGRRRSSSALLVAFSEPRTPLEQRIRRITSRPAEHALRRAWVLGTVAAVPLVLAFCARDPMSVRDPLEERSATTQEINQAPTFTPFTVEPRLRNAAAVQEMLRRSYPPLLRDAGIGGRATVWFFIDETGRVVKTRLNQTSGYDALDEAALAVANSMEFTAALNRDQPTAVWVSIPIQFAARPTQAQQEAVAQSGEPAEMEAARSPGSRPSFTPYTTEPRLANAEQLQRVLQRNYPPLLRGAGIGGRATVWVLIATDGRVASTRLNQSSGYDALDEAALVVAQEMQFRPAENRGKPVAAWVSIPVSFSSK